MLKAEALVIQKGDKRIYPQVHLELYLSGYEVKAAYRKQTTVFMNVQSLIGCHVVMRGYGVKTMDAFCYMGSDMRVRYYEFSGLMDNMQPECVAAILDACSQPLEDVEHLRRIVDLYKL